jgi:hypothetical protein
MTQIVLQIEEQYEYMELTQYKNANNVFEYQSNVRSAKQIELQASLEQPISSTRVSIKNRCLIALSTVKEGCQEMNVLDFLWSNTHRAMSRNELTNKGSN